jgi:hypothetical protein
MGLSKLSAAALAAGAAKGNFGAGAVLQVLQTTTSTQVTNSSTTFAPTGLSQAITPASSSNKVLVVAQVPIVMGSTNNMYAEVCIKRNGSVIQTNKLYNNVSAYCSITYPNTLEFLDAPATTSATTYSIDIRLVSTASPHVYPTVCNDSTPATLTLMEIAG